MKNPQGVYERAFTRNSPWPDKEELLDVVYWSRQILAIIIGVAFGILPLAGIFAIVLYCGITTLAMNVYVSEFQKQDLEEYGGFFELAKEGFMSAFASFLVVWIIVYSSMHASL
ncbi:unnamed protein product [Clavelina lepadiformis]|uniref:Rab5-interacting protein n=1 Tax=Clavelina lepadiformis TaxID=159417 RepID=A0ABP0GMD3_CLALP